MKQLIPRDPLRLAHMLVLLIPTGLLAGAIAFQEIGGLTPCEMCLWQRWPLLAAIAIALVGLFARGHRALLRGLIATAAGGILTSGLIALDHLGVERKWWHGHTACTSSIPKGLSPSEILDAIIHMPIHRCEVPQWTMAGLSLADFNAIISLSTALAAIILIAHSRCYKGA